MQAHKLTASFVKRVVSEVPPTRDTTYADQDLPRHFLRVRPAAHPGQQWLALFGVRYSHNGRKVKLKTGNPRTMDLNAARAAARLVLAEVDAGRDPAREQAEQRATRTVQQLWQAYQVSPEFRSLADGSQVSLHTSFGNHILHRIGKERITDITVPVVKRLVADISADTRLTLYRKSRRLGGAGTAKRVVRNLSALMSWAVGRGELAVNPLIGQLRLPRSAERETVITEPAQYAALLKAMDRLVAAGKLRKQSRAFIITAAFTGMRRGELRTLTVGQVDLVARRITLSFSKGARLAKRGPKAETISLPPIAATALTEIIPADAAADARVFRPYRGSVLTINPDWCRVRDAAGLPPDLVLHSLRHSLATVAVLGGMTGPEVQQLMRHRSLNMTGRYIHLADQVTVRWQDRAVAHLLPGPEPVADLVRLPRAARR